MSKILLAILVLTLLVLPAEALSITAPQVPQENRDMMPEHTENLGQGLWELLRDVLPQLRPDLAEALKVSAALIAAAFIASVLKSASDTIAHTAKLACTACIGSVLFLSANSMVRVGTKTIEEISAYGTLLLPVMASAAAAQGRVTASAALYAGTAVCNAVISRFLSRVLVPAVYLFLALAVADGIGAEHNLKKIKKLLKNSVIWILKTALTIYVSYMGITGIVSSTTDAAVLKTTRTAISAAVPVVGGILANASETVLSSAAVVKSAAGIYGIFAILAIFLAPFLKIWVHYVILRLTEAICGMLDEKGVSELVGDFSEGMGLILAMTASVCFLQLISTVCFLKGAG